MISLYRIWWQQLDEEMTALRLVMSGLLSCKTLCLRLITSASRRRRKNARWKRSTNKVHLLVKFVASHVVAMLSMVLSPIACSRIFMEAALGLGERDRETAEAFSN